MKSRSKQQHEQQQHEEGEDEEAESDLIFVLPGDDISSHIVQQVGEKDKIMLGTGLRRSTTTNNNHVYATLSGCLQYQCRSSGGGGGGKNKPSIKKHVYWIRSSNSARQVQVQDRVVGIVQERVGPDGAGGEYYRVSLGAETRMTAVLSNLSFEGATKRNKPNLEPGQVLYARIAEYVPCLEPVLSCQLGPNDNSSIKAKDWMTNEGVYGILQGGTVFPVTLGLARVLLSSSAGGLWESVTRHPLTSKFEIAIGVNGLIWIHASPSPHATIVLQNAVINSQLLTPEQTAGMVQQLVYTMQKQMKRQQDSLEGV
ncbi:hypothetical protein ACA910_007858 [Epithemia clementina (nom. ined.)]